MKHKRGRKPTRKARLYVLSMTTITQLNRMAKRFGGHAQTVEAAIDTLYAVVRRMKE